jgi:pimeloyl-ACP methyl ester carboxylesterase
MAQLGHERYHLVGHDVGMWVAYALASDQPQAVRSLAVAEAVIPGLAAAPPIFVDPQENIFLWHFLFNQVRDLPEFLIAGRGGLPNFMFDRWAIQRHAVASDVYIRAYSSPGVDARWVCLLSGDS